MRIILTFALLLTLNSCKTISGASTDVVPKLSTTECPSDGICTFEILKNQRLEIKSDAFGSLYPELTPGKFIVLKFQYKRNEIPDTADSGYSELMYLQLSPDLIEMKLQNENLKNVNLLFGRLCFCRGQTGYYRISSGDLSIRNLSENTYQIDLAFTTDEVPQIIQHITEIFQL